MFDNNDTIRNKQKTGNNAKEEKRNNDKTTAKAAAAAILGAALGVGVAARTAFGLVSGSVALDGGRCAGE